MERLLSRMCVGWGGCWVKLGVCWARSGAAGGGGWVRSKGGEALGVSTK